VRLKAAMKIVALMAFACACLPGLHAQSAQPAPPAAKAHTVLELNEGWKFQIGDDAAWADPKLDDAQWLPIDLQKPLTEQGLQPYTEFAWYRLHIAPEQLATVAGESPTLLITGNFVAQYSVYVNGVEMGRTRGLDASPSMYLSPPLMAGLPGNSGTGPLVIAIRTWVGSPIALPTPLLRRVELGRRESIGYDLWLAESMRWNQNATASMVLVFLFLFVAAFAATLYLSQRSHSEYLWLMLLCLAVASNGIADVLFGTERISFEAHTLFAAVFMGHIFMAITLEFVVRFTNATKQRRAVRILQVCLLLLPFVSLLPLKHVYDPLAVAAEVVFCAVVCGLLFRAWRRGQRDAGLMLVPFFFASTADSADTILSYMAMAHWIPERFIAVRFHFGPVEFSISTIAFMVFLSSVMAVILYRFVRVSQDEQRSNAEIAAARSVQSMLIPTELPKSRNFMLESAYLPVNGVGGDFFQVLTLKDDSLLIVVGDVSGKGLQAAMNSSTLVGALRNELSYEPATVLEHLNRVLLGAGYGETRHDSNDAGPSFATCLCARAHPDGRLVIANAGHLGPYRDGREIEIPPGLPLGVIPNVEYEQVTYKLNQGDRLVFLSDGVVEATNAEGELFGFERTQQVSNEAARYIAQTAKHFGQTDDITVVSLYLASCEVREPEAVLNPA
jgi:hypothetical protein